MFQIFDDLIQRASGIVSGDNQAQKRANLGAAAAEPVEKVAREVPNAVIGDESLVAKKSNDYGGREVEKSERNGAKALERSSSAKASFYSGSGIEKSWFDFRFRNSFFFFFSFMERIGGLCCG